MGSGERIRIYTTRRWGQFGLGFWVDNFPFALTVNINLLWVAIELGFGKGYDQ